MARGLGDNSPFLSKTEVMIVWVFAYGIFALGITSPCCILNREDQQKGGIHKDTP